MWIELTLFSVACCLPQVRERDADITPTFPWISNSERNVIIEVEGSFPRTVLGI
jgi:hypothetical protein